jgi:arsenite-transporting ATPase
LPAATRSSVDWFSTTPTATPCGCSSPIDWSRQIDVKVYASVDTAAADDVAKARFGRVIEMMRDPAQSTFAFVMYPEATPIVEASRAIGELASLSIPLGLVVANMVLPDEASRTHGAKCWNMQQSHRRHRGASRFRSRCALDGEVMALTAGRLPSRSPAPPHARTGT